MANQRVALILVAAWSITSSGCMLIYERYHIKATQIPGDGQEDRPGDVPNSPEGGSANTVAKADSPVKRPDTKVRPTTSNKAKPDTNYYRVTIYGWTFLSTSQYSAGWYDADAVDSLFGELRGKTVRVDRVDLEGHKAREVAAPGDESGEGQESLSMPPPPMLESLDGQNLNRRKLVLFLSSNADSLANEISALTTKKELESTLTALVAAPEIEARENARSLDAATGEQDLVLAQELRTLSQTLNAGADAQTVRTTLRDLLRVIARGTQTPEDLASINDAASSLKWFAEHPKAFSLEGGAR